MKDNPIKTAILSVSDKTEIIWLAQELHNRGVLILSTGGTMKVIAGANIPVTSISAFTGSQEVMEGRVKTLHPKVHGAILARRNNEEDMRELTELLKSTTIDLVVVNLYPFEQTLASGASDEECNDNIDVGGPTMVRAAAKNNESVTIITDPADYLQLINVMNENDGATTQAFRQMCAEKAFAMTCVYDLAISRWKSGGRFDGIFGELDSECLYGENAYQKPARFYTYHSDDPFAQDKFKIVQGVPLSYNNRIDLDRLTATVTHIAAAYDINNLGVQHIAVGVKHGNACCAAVSTDPYVALENAIAGDPRDIFGGLFMVNFEIDERGAEILLTHLWSGSKRRPLDGIFAPSFTDGAKALLKRYKDKCRLVVNPALETLDRTSLDPGLKYKPIRGGFLTQPNYDFILDMKNPELSIHGDNTDLSTEEISDILLARAICQTSNSNTITLVNNGMLIGNGTGGTGRVGAAQLAVKRAKDAGHDIRGAKAASDSYFPFPDGPEELVTAGVTIIMTTSGSKNDDVVKMAIVDKGATLVWLDDKIGRGFCWH